MATCLIAGAAGFLGSHLAQNLLILGHEVIGMDNFCTGSKQNLERLSEYSNFSFIEASVSNKDTWPEIRNLDYVYHFASPASPPKYQALGLETLKSNTVGTENLIQLALESGARFIFASTSEIYGDPHQNPQEENYWGNVNPVGPRSVYDESKRLGETLTHYYTQKEGLDGAIIRIFNTYGPWMDPFDGRVVSTFIRQALNSEPLTIFGDGKQTRSFCFVDDLVVGIVKMAESNYAGPLNLGNPSEIDLHSLAEEVGRALGVEVSYEYQSLPVDDPKQRRPDISLAETSLSWHPQTKLEDGIRLTSQWMRQQMTGSH